MAEHFEVIKLQDQINTTNLSVYAQEYKLIRLQSLQTDPQAYYTLYADESNLTDSAWESKLTEPGVEHWIIRPISSNEIPPSDILSTASCNGDSESLAESSLNFIGFATTRRIPRDTIVPGVIASVSVPAADVLTFRCQAVYISPEYRAQGLSTLLISSMLKSTIEKCGSEGEQKVKFTIAAWTENIRATKCYERCGFRVVGVRDIPRRDGEGVKSSVFLELDVDTKG